MDTPKTNISLTDSELEVIKEKRAEEKKRDEEAARIKAANEAKSRLIKERDESQRKELTDKLFEVDTNNIFTLNDRGGIQFSLNDGLESVTLEWHSRPRELKYLLTGAFNSYRQRYFKNPKSLVNAVEKLQRKADENAKRVRERAELSMRALELKKAEHPNASSVTLEVGYDIHQVGRSGEEVSWGKPDIITVRTPNGSISYTFYDPDGEVVFAVSRRSFNDSISDKVDALILG